MVGCHGNIKGKQGKLLKKIYKKSPEAIRGIKLILCIHVQNISYFITIILFLFFFCFFFLFLFFPCDFITVATLSFHRLIQWEKGKLLFWYYELLQKF